MAVTNLPHTYGSNGQVLTTNVTGSTTWTNSNYNFVANNGKSLMTIPHGEDKVILEDRATLEIKGSVKINGVDLEDRLKTIEKVLLIPERDVILEQKHPKLKKLYDEYINELEKYRTWERIKGDD